MEEDKLVTTMESQTKGLAQSECLSWTNSYDMEITGLLSKATANDKAGIVLLIPGFGRKMRNLAPLSMVLNEQGFTTVRFDPTNHVGASEGEIYNATFSSLASDIEIVTNDLSDRFRDQTIFVVANSISARMVMRHANKIPRLQGLVLVFPVVDFSHTIEVAAGEDLVELIQSGSLPEDRTSATLLSYDISINFVVDALRDDMCSLSSTRLDLSRVGSPVTMVLAEEDDWVLKEHGIDVMQPLSDSRQVFTLEKVSHDLSKNLPAARLLSETIVQSIRGMAGLGSGVIEHPEVDDVIEVIKYETGLLSQWISAKENQDHE